MSEKNNKQEIEETEEVRERWHVQNKKRFEKLQELPEYVTIDFVAEQLDKSMNVARHLVMSNEELTLYKVNRTVLIREVDALKFIQEYVKNQAEEEEQKVRAEIEKENERIKKEEERLKKLQDQAEKRKQKEIERAEKEKVRQEKFKIQEQKRIAKLKDLADKYPENKEFQKLYKDAIKSA